MEIIGAIKRTDGREAIIRYSSNFLTTFFNSYGATYGTRSFIKLINASIYKNHLAILIPDNGLIFYDLSYYANYYDPIKVFQDSNGFLSSNLNGSKICIAKNYTVVASYANSTMALFSMSSLNFYKYISIPGAISVYLLNKGKHWVHITDTDIIYYSGIKEQPAQTTSNGAPNLPPPPGSFIERPSDVYKIMSVDVATETYNTVVDVTTSIEISTGVFKDIHSHGKYCIIDGNLLLTKVGEKLIDQNGNIIYKDNVYAILIYDIRDNSLVHILKQEDIFKDTNNSIPPNGLDYGWDCKLGHLSFAVGTKQANITGSEQPYSGYENIEYISPQSTSIVNPKPYNRVYNIDLKCYLDDLYVQYNYGLFN
jgi:hypothetical protein